MTPPRRIHRRKIVTQAEADARAAIPAYAQSQYQKMDDAFRSAMVAAGYCASMPDTAAAHFNSVPRRGAGHTLLYKAVWAEVNRMRRA